MGIDDCIRVVLSNFEEDSDFNNLMELMEQIYPKTHYVIQMGEYHFTGGGKDTERNKGEILITRVYQSEDVGYTDDELFQGMLRNLGSLENTSLNTLADMFQINKHDIILSIKGLMKKGLIDCETMPDNDDAPFTIHVTEYGMSKI